MKDQERLPLRVVLRNFLNHIENLESQNCPEESYEAEFQDLKIFSENVKSLKDYSCLEGEKEVNRKKNRYKDILPFDISRVVLNEYAGIPGSDYINANFIKGASGSPAYIASQGPLSSTVNDFWRMVVQCEVQVIVMACNEEEAGKSKCEKYWVDDGEEKQFGMISVKLLKSSTVCPDFSVRTMRLKYKNGQSIIEERTVCQLHYVAWPDHGVPTVVQPLLDMVRLVRDTQASETLPVLVHCSAGCGRTGTICAIDYVWGLLRTGKLTNDFSLLGLIRDMRKQRIAMVQTKEQYVLVHQAVRELFKEQLCMIDSHPYENVDTNGLLVIKDEENTYDCIEYVSTCSSEEKHDNKKEKEIKPPPLPCKRNLTVFSSKHEKDFENLTAQQKSIYSLSNNKNHLTLIQLSEKKKSNKLLLKNPSSKKVYDNQIKSEGNRPIPSKGILRVPQLETLTPKCSSTANIKRSKSLKVVSTCDKGNLTYCRGSPENKRRSSLESNFDEQTIDSENILYDLKKLEPNSSHELNKKIVLLKTNKYDLISEHRPFLRSLTSLDLHKKLQSKNLNSGSNLVPLSNGKINLQKCKLLRSNSQINISKKNEPFLCNPRTNCQGTDLVDPNVNMNRENANHYSHLLNFNASLESLKEKNQQLFKRSLEKSPLAMKQSLIKPNSASKEPFHRKINELPKKQGLMNISKSINSKILQDTSKMRSSNRIKNDHSNGLVVNCYGTNKNAKPVSKPDRCQLYALDVSSSSSLLESSTDSSPVNYRKSSYLRTNHLKETNTQKKLQLSKSLEIPLKNELTLPVNGFSKEPYNCNPYREDIRTRQVNSNHEEYLNANSYVAEEPSYMPHPSSSSFVERFHNDDIDLINNPWSERDRVHVSHNRPGGSKDYFCYRPRPNTTSQQKAENKDSSWTFINELDVKKRIPSVEAVDEIDAGHDLKPYEPSFNKDPSFPLVSMNESEYAMQNRKNLHQYNISSHSVRNSSLTVSSSSVEVANCSVNHNTANESIIALKRNVEVPVVNQDNSYCSHDPHRSYRGNECFDSAPGIDLDQVAASINKNDGNLMKVTLEAFQARKTKFQMTPKERKSKGASTTKSSVDYKKQQQYL